MACRCEHMLKQHALQVMMRLKTARLTWWTVTMTELTTPWGRKMCCRTPHSWASPPPSWLLWSTSFARAAGIVLTHRASFDGALSSVFWEGAVVLKSYQLLLKVLRIGLLRSQTCCQTLELGIMGDLPALQGNRRQLSLCAPIESNAADRAMQCERTVSACFLCLKRQARPPLHL